MSKRRISIATARGALLFALGGAALAGCASAPRGAAPASAAAANPEVQRAFYLMGTTLEMSVAAASREAGLAASEAAYEAARAAELRLSTWTEDSELARVNRGRVGEETRLSPLLARDLRNAYRCGEATRFAFTPWIGPLVQAWGLRKGGRIPSARERAAAARASASDAFGWTEQGIVKRNPGARVEEGAFGKGIGLDDALDALKKNGIRQAVLNFGGQVSILGEETETIEVSDPGDRSRTLLRFQAASGSISTSGNSEHGMKVKGPHGTVRIGHELDPATGRPAPYDGSVTVYAPTGFEADCLSTALFVMGADGGLGWARAHSKQALWILPGKRPGTWVARTSCGWRPALERISENVEVRSDCDNKEESLNHG